MTKIVKKVMTETYQVRNEGRGSSGWANINVQWGNESAHIVADSDYGSYCHYWGSCGKNPKKFLCEIDFQYTMQKLNEGDISVFASDKLDDEMKKIIIQTRRDYGYEGFTKKMARECWDDLLEIYEGSKDFYYETLMCHEHSEWLFGGCPEGLPYPTRLNAQVVGFWEECWIPFTQQLEKELEMGSLQES